MGRQILDGQVKEAEPNRVFTSPFLTETVSSQDDGQSKVPPPESPRSSKPNPDADKLLPSITLEDSTSSILAREAFANQPLQRSVVNKPALPFKPPEPYSLGEKIMNVARPIGRGAAIELTENFGRVALSGAVGFGVGYGLAWVPPQYKKYIAIAGLVVTGVQLARSVPAWYESAKKLTDHTVGNHDRWKAEEVMEGVGAGTVDLAAGIAGGAMGSRVGNYHIDTLKPIRFDSSGRPIKLPLAEDRGSAYLKYDRSGSVTEYVEQYKNGWRNVIRSPQQPAGGKYTYFAEHRASGVESTTVDWLGKFSYDKNGVTVVDETGILNLRANGPSTFVQTAEQAAKSLAAKAANKVEYETAARMAQELSRRAGGAAAGLGMGMRMGRPF